MGIIDTIKKWWIKGGDALVAMVEKEEYNSILEHPKVDFEQAELNRIKESFRHHSGDYPQIEYLNTERKTKKRDYFHLNMTKTVAEHMSTLVFNEQCEINVGIPDEDTGEYPKSDASDFVKEILDRTEFKDVLANKIEAMFATGGLVVRPYYDAGTNTIDFSWCLADAFIPLRSNTNSISEGVIPTVTAKQEGREKYYYTLLEFHEWENNMYIISNELYKSSDSAKLGKRVPLTSLDVYAELKPTTTIQGLSRPLFSYLKPATFNNLNPRSPLGIGLCDNSRTTIRAINDTYDQFHWEIYDGQQKHIVSDHFLRTGELGDKRPVQYFDSYSSKFVALPGGIDDMIHKDITTPIRSDQYIDSINYFIKRLETEVGFSSNTFVFDGTAAQTATEVISKDSKTYQSRNKHVNEVSKFIKNLIISTFELAKFVKVDGKPLYTGKIPERDEIGIDFDDGVFNDRESELNFLSKARMNRLIPTVEAIKRLYDLPQSEAEDWHERIKEEEKQSSYDYQQAYAESSLLGGEE